MALNVKWQKVILDILKYALGALVGALGITVSGCACFPTFNF